MTQDEIIEMAKEAGLLPCQGIHTGDLEAFAKLVADKENKECEKLAATPVGTIAAAIRARRNNN